MTRNPNTEQTQETGEDPVPNPENSGTIGARSGSDQTLTALEETFIITRRTTILTSEYAMKVNLNNNSNITGHRLY